MRLAVLALLACGCGRANFDAQPDARAVLTQRCDRDNNVQAKGLQGALDEVRLYNRVLSPTEVATLAGN